jgi:hypothetical protein
MKPERPFFPLKVFILVVIFALVICSFLPKVSEAAGIKSVQRGTVTFTSGANRMAVTSPAFQPVEPSKTIVWGGIVHGGGRVSGANPNASRIAFELESGTTLALERLGSPTSTPVVEWQAVEFATGVSVQRGVRSLTTTETTVNVPIPTNVNINKSFVLISVAPNMTGQGNDERWTIRAQLTGANNLELFRADSGIAVDVYWQVVEIQGASVQRGLTTFPANVNTASTNIPASVDLSKSFLIMSFAGGAGINGIETRYMVRGALTNGNTLTFNRVASSNHAVNLAWEVVTMNDGTTVQSGSRSTVAGSDTLLDQTIGFVDLSRAFVYLSVQGGASGATNSLDDVSWTGALTSQTNLRLQRGVGGSQGTVNWQVVQFAPPTPTKLAVTSINGGNNPVAGSPFSAIIQAQDAGGNPLNVSGDTGISISLKTGTGTLAGTLIGTISAGTNQISISGISYSKAEGGIVLTATRTSGDALTAGDSAPFGVNPGAATALVIRTQPTNAPAGSAIPGSLTVAVQDSLGNVVTSSTASITVAIGTNPDGGTLSGTVTRNAASGVASFSDLSLDKVGNGYTLTVSSTGLTGATSAAFNISPGVTTKLAFTVQPTDTNTGGSINGPPTIAVQDFFGNQVTSSTAVITMAIGSNPSAATLGGTKTKGATSGIANFTNLTINQPGTGYTLTASSPGLSATTSNPLHILSTVVTLTINKIGTGSGTVTSSSGGIDCGSVCSASLNSGTVVTLTPIPAAGSTFVRWSDNTDCSDGTVTVNVSKTCTATFNTVTASTVRITSPKPDSIVERTTIFVRGEISAPSGIESVTVDGIDAQAKDGLFGTIIPVDLGANQITATLVDLAGNTVSDSVVVTRQNPSTPDYFLIWTSLKDSLRSGDIETALDFITVKSRGTYGEIFAALGSELSEIDFILTDITAVAIGQDDAEFEMFRSGRSFEIIFARDDDGIWRLESF